MDLTHSPAEEEFRARLREWLAKVLPSLPPKPSPDDWPGRRAYDLGWQRMLYDAGYADVHWDASPTTRLIFLEETERAGAPVRGRRLRRAAARGAHHRRRGHRRAAGALAAADPARRGGLVPGLQRAGRRVRPRGAAHARAEGRRRLRGERGPRSGPRTPKSPTGASCWCARTRRRRSTGASPGWRCPWTRPASPYGPCVPSPAPPSSPRSSSTRCGCRSPTGSGRRTTAGA